MKYYTITTDHAPSHISIMHNIQLTSADVRVPNALILNWRQRPGLRQILLWVAGIPVQDIPDVQARYLLTSGESPSALLISHLACCELYHASSHICGWGVLVPVRSTVTADQFRVEVIS